MENGPFIDDSPMKHVLNLPEVCICISTNIDIEPFVILFVEINFYRLCILISMDYTYLGFSGKHRHTYGKLSMAVCLYIYILYINFYTMHTVYFLYYAYIVYIYYGY